MQIGWSCQEAREDPVSKGFLTQSKMKVWEAERDGASENRQSVSSVLSDRQVVGWEKKTTTTVQKSPNPTLQDGQVETKAVLESLGGDTTRQSVWKQSRLRKPNLIIQVVPNGHSLLQEAES